MNALEFYGFKTADDFVMEFRKVYTDLYYCKIPIEKQLEATEMFQNLLAAKVYVFSKAVSEYIDECHDFISSDREAAAFIFTLGLL